MTHGNGRRLVFRRLRHVPPPSSEGVPRSALAPPGEFRLMLEGHQFDAVSISVPDPEAAVRELQPEQADASR